MTIPEIYAKIEENNNKIKEMFDPSTFVYVKEAHAIMRETEELMKECARQGKPYT